MAKLIRLSTPIEGDECPLTLCKEEVEAVQSLVGRVEGSDEGREWTDKVWYAIGASGEFDTRTGGTLVYYVADHDGKAISVRLMKK